MNFRYRYVVKMNKKQWNPWHGCHKCSPGCLNCYVYFLDKLRNIDSNIVKKSKTNFNLPLKKNRQGEYKIKSGSEVATCFTSDFFLQEADTWRQECWHIMKIRSDVTFLICTKRIERFAACLPEDWNDGYDNVIIAVTCENQKKAEERLPVFLKCKAKKKYIFVSPILEYVNLSFYLKTGAFSLVSVSGESYDHARTCNFEWIKKIKEDCDKYQVKFDFHQTGSNFIMNNKRYKITHFDEYDQAKKGLKYLEKESLKKHKI